MNIKLQKVKPSSLVVKPSTIPGAGDGLFTKDDIPEGELVFSSFTANGDKTGIFDKDYDQSFTNSKVNHSKTPNISSVWIGNSLWKYALRDIQAGEELLSDYSFTMGILPYPPQVDFLWFEKS